MKRVLLTFALAAGMVSAAMAQTDFRHISYAEGLEAAKAEGKLLFVDFYTEWCGPCKMMANNVFPQKEVGDYMNAKFVCLKIDAEKGEGVELAKRFDIKAYPTFITISADGKELGRREGGMDADELPMLVERMLNPDLTPERMKARYESGERTAELMAVYAAYLYDEAINARSGMEKQIAAVNKMVQDYFAGLTDAERLKPENLFIYTDFSHNVDAPSARFMAEHRNDFPSEMKERVMESLGRAYELAVLGYFTGEKPYDAVACGKLEQEVADLGLDKDKAFAAAFRLIREYAEGDLDAYLTLCEREYDRLEMFGASLLNALPTLVAAGDTKVQEHAVRFIRSLLKDMTVNEIYFSAMALQELEGRMKTE